MKIKHNWLKKLGGLGVTTLIRQWMRTLDYQAAFYDPAVDVVHPNFRGPAIFLFWHEYIPVPFYLRPHARIALLVSRHTDAELLSQAARLVGFQTVRGSTGRGGTTALRELFEKGRRINLAITPDGPRGPRRQLSPGPIYLSSKLGVPLVIIAVGYDRPWRLPTWDRFAVPRPHSRCRIIMSPCLQMPPDLDRDNLEQYRRQTESLFLRLTDEAESWAASGARHPLQQPTWSQSAARCRLDRVLSPEPTAQAVAPPADETPADASPGNGGSAPKLRLIA